MTAINLSWIVSLALLNSHTSMFETELATVGVSEKHKWDWKVIVRWKIIFHSIPLESFEFYMVWNEINPEYSLEGLMLKLKLQYFGHLMRRANSLENTLMLEKIEGRRRRGRQMVGWYNRLNGHEFEQTPGDSEGERSLACCSPWGRKE